TTQYGYPTLPLDESQQPITDTVELYRGFPLIEDIEFAALGNHGTPSGDCYWRALSQHLQGTSERWALVKAEHLSYLYHVLRDPKHPRYELYNNSLNTKFYISSGSNQGQGAFKANIWQLLHMPHSWTPAAMQQVSADLYNIHLITFSISDSSDSPETCEEVSVRGAYNSRHVFLLYKDRHFQPLIPNEHLSWEFRYPRLSASDTARYRNAPKADNEEKTGLGHPWRNDWTGEVPPPVPRNYGCDLSRLSEMVAGLTQQQQQQQQ
ncbi:hypothetical protein GGS20DRAFT_543979, partial [Poronia punctata]